jgi:predicted O-linked N-acetylglucosamine transferase (SPINDLY family)
MIRSLSLKAAKVQGQSGCFQDMLASCQRVLDNNLGDIEVFLETGSIYLRYGFLSLARYCFEKVREWAPTELRAWVGLGNVAHEAGDHALASHLYSSLCEAQPSNPVFRRNALLNLEYNPFVSDLERFTQAKAWGEWATVQASGPHPRPPRFKRSEPIRVGYVSADFCQHTVGFFIKEVLKSHDPKLVTVYAYGSGPAKDWVTAEIQNACQFRDVASLDDISLANLIRRDTIDVLVDLSGHTAGSRLTAFALRPAPVQVSWLGYFATTGLPSIDAIFLDDYHAPPGIEAHFVEKIIRLPSGRICYQPAHFAPDMAEAPCIIRGYVTFGSFNNTSKYNDAVFDLWSRVLLSVSGSRLVLKWRTFNDEALRRNVVTAFSKRGVDPSRIELRGPSFHADLLNEYSDIDIALDPFPFTGGITSCESLWMGVPVITLPMSRVVSRQTLSILSVIGLPELVAKDAEDYVRLAVQLAMDPGRLKVLRSGMRERMKTSSLMDVHGFAKGVELAILGLTR